MSISRAAAEAAVRSLLDAARDRLGARMGGGRVSNLALEAEQSAAHALAWLATYAESLTRMRDWAEALEAEHGEGSRDQVHHPWRPLCRGGALGNHLVQTRLTCLWDGHDQTP